MGIGAHQIVQNYTPADPQFSFSDFDSWRGFLYGSGNHNITVTQSLQFPGKGILQGHSARRNAEIAHLPYLAALRDTKAQAQTAYYQIQLDLALSDLIVENVANLESVLKVAKIAYVANQATQGDYINAKFALEADREALRQQAVTILNDKTALIVVIGWAISIALLTRVFQPILMLLRHRYIGLTEDRRRIA